MTTKIFGAIAFKAFAIYVIVRLPIDFIPVASLIATSKSFGTASEPWKYIFLFLSVHMLIAITLSVLIWKIGNNILSQLPETSETYIRSNHFQQVVLQLLGIYLIVNYVSPITSQISMLIQQPADIFSYIAKLIGCVVEVLIGIFLIYKADVLVTLFEKVRNNKPKSL